MKFFIIIFLFFLNACSSYQALQDNEDSVDISQIERGISRNFAEQTLGQPKETITKDGEKFYRYYIKTEPKSSSSRAAGHAAMDLLTMGMWEVVGTGLEATNESNFIIDIMYDDNNIAKKIYKTRQEDY